MKDFEPQGSANFTRGPRPMNAAGTRRQMTYSLNSLKGVFRGVYREVI